MSVATCGSAVISQAWFWYRPIPATVLLASKTYYHRREELYVNFQSPFSNANFNSLQPGNLFFHPLAGGHSPAIKVVRADGKQTVVDLNLEQENQMRVPTLMSCDDFIDLTVVAVQTAFIRPKPELSAIRNGSGGGGPIGRAALMMLPTQTLLKVRGPNGSSLCFDISNGAQVGNPDSAKCLWSADWQIVVRENDEDLVLFERGA